MTTAGDAMSHYVLARGGETERTRPALLERFHGPLTVAALEGACVAPGWRCLEAAPARAR